MVFIISTYYAYSHLSMPQHTSDLYINLYVLFEDK